MWVHNGAPSPIEVDLLVHQRNGANYFCAEFKPFLPVDIADEAKVLYLLGRMAVRDRQARRMLQIPRGAYQLGATIGYRFGADRCTWSVTWYGTNAPTWELQGQNVPRRDRKAALRQSRPPVQLHFAQEQWNFEMGEPYVNPPAPPGGRGWRRVLYP